MTERLAHSKSEMRRLEAQGVPVRLNPAVETGWASPEERAELRRQLKDVEVELAESHARKIAPEQAALLREKRGEFRRRLRLW